jgi:UDP-galactopyranose mutase
MKILIVGAGLFGSICAHELNKAGHTCHVIEKRDHIGGNIYTRYSSEAACHEHVYGAHIFHTNSQKIWEYICRFASFNHYVNRVKAIAGTSLYSFPINLFTIYQISGAKTPSDARRWLEAERQAIASPTNMEEYCLSVIGPTLYRLFIEGYTTKQWGRHPRHLPADIVKRLPVRLTYDDNYFTSRYQGIPIGGYTAIIEEMLSSSTVELGGDFLADRGRLENKFDFCIYTGPIDAYFGYKRGILEYRSLRFEQELVRVIDYQGNAVINYTDADVPWTRIVEHKHFDMNLTANSSLITYEYPAEWQPGGDEFYPINDTKNAELHRLYAADALKLSRHIHFGGRLAEYRYYDMHQVVGAALAFCERFLA